jgi:hypothetical protein
MRDRGNSHTHVERAGRPVRADPDDVRPRRVCVRRTRRGSERLQPRGRHRRASLRRGPHRGRRRRPPRAGSDATVDRRVRPPTTAATAPTRSAAGADTARDRGLDPRRRRLSNSEIAERLVVSDETVKTHVSHVLGKLALRDRAQAVVAAYESGLVSPRPFREVLQRRAPRGVCVRRLPVDRRIRTRRRGSRRGGSGTRSPADRAARRWRPRCVR